MILYRGENIQNGNPKRIEMFKSILQHGLPLEFINGGDPYRVQKMGLFDATVAHVAKNNLGSDPQGLKHFISFSADSVQAEYYATRFFKGGQLLNNTYEVFQEYYTEDLDSYRSENIWHYTQHMRIELDIAGSRAVDDKTPFVRILSYNDGRNKLLIWDVVSYLNFQLERLSGASEELLAQFPGVIQEIHTAIGYAETDSEWLVASLDPIPPQQGVAPSQSGLIAHGSVLRINHHVDSNYFTT